MLRVAGNMHVGEGRGAGRSGARRWFWCFGACVDIILIVTGTESHGIIWYRY